MVEYLMNLLVIRNQHLFQWPLTGSYFFCNLFTLHNGAHQPQASARRDARQPTDYRRQIRHALPVRLRIYLCVYL